MVKQSLCVVAAWYGTEKFAFEKLCFQLDYNGPKYQFSLGKQEFVSDCLEKNDFTLRMISPMEMEIKDKTALENLLDRLYYVNNDITYSAILFLNIH